IENRNYSIRWITPECELDICGHGSLSAGYVIFNFIDPSLQAVDLHSRIEILPVTRKKDLITLNFPSKKIESCSLPVLEQGLGAKPKEIYQHKTDRCIAVFDTEEQIKQ